MLSFLLLLAGPQFSAFLAVGVIGVAAAADFGEEEDFFIGEVVFAFFFDGF